ncbi:MAG: response regulator, partial [Victivallales bacterium]|nr:response regulator [Victivallales bacterium]
AAEKARSMFFSIVSHDIRTPLNAIIGYSQLLRKGIGDPKELDEALQAIEESGTTLLELVNDVLDLAKMDSGQMVLHTEPVRLGKLTDDVFATFRLVASQKGIKLINSTADVPTVLLDAHRFRQILFNLIGNAIKFTAQGSVTVSASYADTNLEVAVSDTGCGIPADMQARIFDPFFQIHDPSHTAARVMGSGLGLSICQRLVEAMGGEISVESEVGKGSTFKAHLSGIVVAETKNELAVVSKPTVDRSKLPKHVLVVDDSAVNRAVLTALLKQMGVTAIDQARDGGEALAKLDSAINEAHPYDFVFSDLWMPNVNGMEMIEKLRKDSRFANLPVFVLTADTEFDNDERAALFTGTLLKPLTYDKLAGSFATI